MDKIKARTDVTYCVNDSCPLKIICERHKDKYIFDENELYWFCEFDDIECGKMHKNEL